MKRAMALVMVMLAASASGAGVAGASSRHIAQSITRGDEGQKTQWAPTRNFSGLNTRFVIAIERQARTSPYAGEEGRTATGLGVARYYDSKLGVFLSRDSFEGLTTVAPSLHRYAYAHGNPLMHRDPSGRVIPLIIMLAVLGAEVGLFGSIIQQEVEEGKDLATVDYAKAGEAAAVGAAGGVALGAAVVAAPEVAATLIASAKAGTVGVGVALAGETTVDLASVGLNGYQCSQGDQASCAGTVVAAVDAVTGPFNVTGDAALGRAMATKTRSPTTSGAPDVVSVDSTATPDTKPTTATTSPDATSGSGTWTITMFKKDDPHFVHTFEDPAAGQKISVHRVTDPKTKNTVVEKVNLDGKHGIKGAAEDRVVPVPNIKKAMKAARDSIGPDGKPLNVKAGGDMNSCVSLGCEVGQAGGAPVPADKNQWRDWTYNQFGETPKK